MLPCREVFPVCSPVCVRWSPCPRAWPSQPPCFLDSSQTCRLAVPPARFIFSNSGRGESPLKSSSNACSPLKGSRAACKRPERWPELGEVCVVAPALLPAGCGTEDKLLMWSRLWCLHPKMRQLDQVTLTFPETHLDELEVSVLRSLLSHELRLPIHHLPPRALSSLLLFLLDTFQKAHKLLEGRATLP